MENSLKLEHHIEIDVYRKKLPENFFAFGVYIKNGIARHAVILIRVEGDDYLCHFPGNRKPELLAHDEIESISKNFDSLIYRISNIVDCKDSSMLLSSLAILKRICNSSNMKYSFIHDGSSYRSEDGSFDSKHGLPEFGSCVGFCLNAINTLISGYSTIDDYFVKLEDWPIFEPDAYTKELDSWAKTGAIKNFPQLDIKSYAAYHKRISPLEFLCLPFVDIEIMPIPKTEVDAIKDLVQEQISTLQQAV